MFIFYPWSYKQLISVPFFLVITSAYINDYFIYTCQNIRIVHNINLHLKNCLLLYDILLNFILIQTLVCLVIIVDNTATIIFMSHLE